MEIRIIRGKEYLYGKAYQDDPRWREEFGGEPELKVAKVLEPLENFDCASEITSTKYDSQEELLGKTTYYSKDGSRLLLDIFFDKFIKLIS